MPELNETINCPICGHPVLYGAMIWLNGRCICHPCYCNKLREMGHTDAADIEEKKYRDMLKLKPTDNGDGKPAA